MATGINAKGERERERGLLDPRVQQGAKTPTHQHQPGSRQLLAGGPFTFPEALSPYWA